MKHLTLSDLFERAKGEHTSRGFSTCGQTPAQQYLSKVVPTDKPWGIFHVGTEAHKTYQLQIFPAGLVVEDTLNVESPQGVMWLKDFEIMEHEQLVMFPINGVRRWSPIDTPVYFYNEDAFEVWDWKTIKGNSFTRYLKTAKPENREQANLYAIRWGQAWKIPVPRYRIWYINKDDWSQVKCFMYPTDLALAKHSLQKLQTAAKMLQGDKSCGPWSQNATCLWTNKWCDKYCNYRKKCMQMYSAEYKHDFTWPKEVRNYQEVKGCKPTWPEFF
jgi:hypothetical protein